MEFNVTTICPQDDVHALNLHAYAKAVAAGLHSNKYSVQCELNKIDDNKKNVILGAHLLDPSEQSRIPSGSIIVNLEQLMAKGAPVSKAYLDLLQRHVVWDYSKNNMEFLLSRFGIKHAQYLPVSYHESMVGLKNKKAQDIDVLFYGILNARRRAVLTALDEAGLNVQVLVGVYGDERDEYISRSKVVLSVSYYAADILESTRVLDAMAKGKAVVAECSENADFDPRMSGGAVLCDYDDLVAECKRLVADSESRKSLESEALKTCGALDVSRTVGDVLETLGLAERELLEHSQDVSRPEVTDLEASVSQMLELSSAGDTFEAERLAVAIIGKNPSIPEAWNIIGAAAAQKDELSEAQMAFQCVVSLSPEIPTGHENLGRVLLAQGKLEESLSYIERAFELEPESLRVGELLAQLLNRTEQFDRAMDLGQDLLSENPKSKCLILEMARACRGLNRIDPACQLYLAAVACDLSDAEVQAELAVYFYENGRIKDAIAFYADVLDRDKLDVHAYHGLGTCYHFMGHLETALEFYEQVLQLQPDMPGTLRNISHIYHVLVRPAEAIEAISKVVRYLPDDVCAKVQLSYYKKHVCDWSDPIDFAAIEDRSSLNGASPFQVLPMIDDPELQLGLARNYHAKAQHSCEKPALQSRNNCKIRVGFLGSDFHDHATLVLMSGIFREYDKSRFEFFVYSYGVSKVSAYRERVEEQVDVFRDLEGWTDGEIVDAARADQLDIAIDLKGFTNTGRLEPFEIGIAPLQISYLGYPGTVGRDCFDYMIADDITVPLALEYGYSEQIMSMPNAYQPNDCDRPLELCDDTRQDHGLPEEGFVFCCFNNNYKISAEEFDIWMRLLTAVDGSVLWLLDANEFVRSNLTAEAEKRGVSADRLVFAPRVSVADHLSRHQHADLFLDTFNVNAHTTTSDALWAGLPVLTKLGKQFAARVSGALLNAAELPELACHNAEEYEAMALRLATDPEAMTAIRERLNDNKAQKPLFDTALYMRHFESLLEMAVERARNGQQPKRLELNTGMLSTCQSAA